MKLRWQNKRCTSDGLRLMQEAVKRVEERLNNSSEETKNQIHIPTAINDELYQNCISVAVAPNASEGCCFRGMECTQFELDGKVYNIAIFLRRVVKENATTNSAAQTDQTQKTTSTTNGNQQSQNTT